MTPQEFRAIRHRLGLTQVQLARLLGYNRSDRISEMERKTNPKPVPGFLDLVMEALDSGFWPKAWPRKEACDDNGPTSTMGAAGSRANNLDDLTAYRTSSEPASSPTEQERGTR